MTRMSNILRFAASGNSDPGLNSFAPWFEFPSMLVWRRGRQVMRLSHAHDTPVDLLWNSRAGDTCAWRAVFHHAGFGHQPMHNHRTGARPIAGGFQPPPYQP